MAARANAEFAKAFKDCGFETHLAHECLFSGRGLCDELITPPEHSYRIGAWLRVIYKPLVRGPWPALDRKATRGKRKEKKRKEKKRKEKKRKEKKRK